MEEIYLICEDSLEGIFSGVYEAYLLKKFHDQIHIDSFIQQANDFKKNHSGVVDKIIKYFSINAATMPWLVLRASELLAWYQSGEYDRILRKSRSIM